MTKLCIDCRWCSLPQTSKAEYAKCLAPFNMRPNLVDGRLWPVLLYCSTLRDGGECGSDGKHWQAQPDAADREEVRTEYDAEQREAEYCRAETYCDINEGQPK